MVLIRNLLVTVAAALGIIGSASAQCPDAPSVVGVSGGSLQCATSATVLWTAVSGVNGYEVARGLTASSGSATVIASVPAGATSYFDNTPPLNQQVFYFVRSLDNPGIGCTSGIGAWSSPTLVSLYQPIVSAPAPASASASSCGSMTISWGSVARATSYQLWVSTTSNFADASLFASPTGTSATGVPSDFGARYVWVRGVNVCGTGPMTGPTYIPPRGGVTVTGVTFAAPTCDRVSATVSGTSGTFLVRFTWMNPPGGGTMVVGSVLASGSPISSNVLPGVAPGQAVTMRVQVIDPSCGGSQQNFDINGNVGGVTTVNVPSAIGTVAMPISILGLVNPPTPLGVTYSWKKDGVVLGSDGGRITGLTSTTLSFSSVKIEDVGLYQLVVTNTCGTGSEVVGGGVLAVRVPCRADYDQSGNLSTTDVFEFLNGWFAGCP